MGRIKTIRYLVPTQFILENHNNTPSWLQLHSRMAKSMIEERVLDSILMIPPQRHISQLKGIVKSKQKKPVTLKEMEKAIFACAQEAIKNDRIRHSCPD